MNITALTNKIINGKWLIDGNSHSTLCNMINKYIENPSLNKYIEQEYTLGGICKNELQEDATAIIPICGILVKGVSEEEEQMFGLENTDEIRYRIEDAMNDESVKDILLIFNSPGGETVGIEELGRYIAECNKIKKIYCWTETLSCSASYWLMSQGSILGMTPSAKVGSIGVYCLIENMSKALEKEGIKIEAIYSGEYKLMGHNFRDLTDKEKKILQLDINEQHNKFKQAVLSNRKLDNDIMEGLSYEGQAALDNGLIDIVVDTLDEFLTTPEMKDINMRLNKTEKKAVATEIKSEVKEVVPGVPMDEKAEVKDEPKKDEPETKKDASETPDVEENCTCPHCGKNMKDLPEKKADEDNDEDDKPVDSDPKEEPKKEEKKCETKIEEPKIVLTNEMWNEARGLKSIPTNPFYVAASELVKNFKP